MTSMDKAVNCSMTDAGDIKTQSQLLALCHLADMPPRLFSALLQRYNSLDGIFNMAGNPELDELARGTGAMVKKGADRLAEAEALVGRYRQRDIRLITRFDPEYSQLLFELNDPPPLLFVRGKMPRQDRSTVAIIGGDNPTADGIALITTIARELASRSVQIISSLTAAGGSGAHLGSETAAGSSFAVVESGFDHLEDEGAVPLAIDIIQSGGLISESLPENKRKPDASIMANRLIVGLAQAVVITEIYADSTLAMDIASFCDDIGKLLFFVVDQEVGPLTDEAAFAHLTNKGAIVLEDYNSIDTIAAALV